MSSQYHTVGSSASFSNSISMEFDGINEVVIIPNSSDFYFGGVPFSITAWIKMDDATRFGIFGKGSAVQEEYSLAVNNVDKLQFTLNRSGAQVARVGDVAITGSQGSWIQVACTNNGGFASGDMTLYKDGALMASTGSGSIIGFPEVVGTEQIGNRTNSGAFWADGRIKDVAVWDKELSLAEVASTIVGGAPANLTNLAISGNIVSWNRLGDGTGDVYSTAADIVGGHDGVMTNMSAGNYVNDSPP